MALLVLSLQRKWVKSDGWHKYNRPKFVLCSKANWNMQGKKKFTKMAFSPEVMSHLVLRLQKAQAIFQQPTHLAIKGAQKSLEIVGVPIKKAQEALSEQLHAVAEVLSDALSPMRKLVEENPAYLKWLADKHEAVETQSKETFKALKREFVFFMAQNGYLLPDEEQFFNWYFFVKYLSTPINKQTIEEMATVTPEDLQEYEAYKREMEGREEETTQNKR
jgi:hypothetical protein